MKFRWLNSLGDISREDWDQLQGPSFPFSRHDFLSGLERTGCVGATQVWEPYYLTAWHDDTLVGALYLYRKHHSYGEFIFDWDWVRAYEMNGKAYFPKMTAAIPFTPATGPKLLIHPKAGDPRELSLQLVDRALEQMQNLGCHSLHFLFIPEAEIPIFAERNFFIRYSYQFHWENHGFGNFKDFLATLKRKKRDNILRERKKISAHPIEIHRFTGAAIERQHLHEMYGFYLSTIQKNMAIPYLSREFFEEVFWQMRDRVVLFFARSEGRWVAGSLMLYQGEALFGRYWGCHEFFENLHFELCYYQGIEFCIERQMELFEAGAQGEHKIARGFLPRLTYSAHFIADEAFRRAIGHFVNRERELILRGIKNFSAYSPVKASNQSAE